MDLNVYLLQGGLPFYKEFLEYAPQGIHYLNEKERNSYEDSISTYYTSKSYNFKRHLASLILERFRLPIINYISASRSDLIHSNRGILILNRKPWVMDVDYVGYFFGNNMFNTKILERSYMKSIVEKFLTSKYCKKIICWSYAGQKSICNVFDNDNIISKTEVLYPATPIINFEKIKHDNVRILYISSSFENKGGYEVLSAFEDLLKNYEDIELIFKCDVPEEVKSRYNYSEIHYFPYKSQLLSKEELIKEFHMSSDIFLYPTFGDLFGLSLLDAMVAGLPIVSTNTFAIPEIVEDGETGYLLDLPYSWHDTNYIPVPKENINYPEENRTIFVEEMVKKISLLIEDSHLREEMGRKGRKLVEDGKFSINERNKKLKKIYEDSVK